MKQTTIRFSIKQNGSIFESVENGDCTKCIDLTQSIEDKLGSVIARTYKPEYFQSCEINVPLQYHTN